jgi:hypothetical protein
MAVLLNCRQGGQRELNEWKLFFVLQCGGFGQYDRLSETETHVTSLARWSWRALIKAWAHRNDPDEQLGRVYPFSLQRTRGNRPVKGACPV